jgi:hypothetical protein
VTYTSPRRLEVPTAVINIPLVAVNLPKHLLDGLVLLADDLGLWAARWSRDPRERDDRMFPGPGGKMLGSRFFTTKSFIGTKPLGIGKEKDEDTNSEASQEQDTGMRMKVTVTEGEHI